MIKYINDHELYKIRSNLKKFILLKKGKVNQRFDKFTSEQLSYQEAVDFFYELDNVPAYVNRYVVTMKTKYLINKKLSKKSSRDLMLLLKLNNKELNEISINEFVNRRKNSSIRKFKEKKLSYKKAVNIYLSLFLDDFFINKENKIKDFKKIFKSYLLKQGLNAQALYELINNVEDIYEDIYLNEFENFNSIDILYIISDILSSKSLEVDIVDIPDLLMNKSIPNSMKHFSNIWNMLKDNVDIDCVNEMYDGDCYQYVYENYNESGAVLCVKNCRVNKMALELLNYLIQLNTSSVLNYICYENDNAYLVLSDTDIPYLSFLLIFIGLLCSKNIA